MDAQLVTFLRDKHIVRMATCKNGRPHVVPLWYVYDANEGVFWISSRGRKVENVRANPNVALVIDTAAEGQAQAAYLFEGRAKLITDGVREMTYHIYHKYLGEERTWPDYFKQLAEDPKRVLLKITIEKTVDMLG